MKLSPAQLAALARAVAGEDRLVPERVFVERGRVTFVMPPCRFVVEPGCYCPHRSGEYRTARVLHRMKLFEPWSGGVGGYRITARGRRELAAAR